MEINLNFQASQHQSFGSSPAASFNLASPPSLPPNINPSPNMLPHPSPGGLLANSPSNPLHVPSPAGLMPTSSPGPCPTVPVGHSPAGSFMGQTGMLFHTFIMSKNCQFYVVLKYNMWLTAPKGTTTGQLDFCY